jgi:hypothetical protein
LNTDAVLSHPVRGWSERPLETPDPLFSRMGFIVSIGFELGP